ANIAGSAPARGHGEIGSNNARGRLRPPAVRHAQPCARVAEYWADPNAPVVCGARGRPPRAPRRRPDMTRLAVGLCLVTPILLAVCWARVGWIRQRSAAECMCMVLSAKRIAELHLDAFRRQK